MINEKISKELQSELTQVLNVWNSNTGIEGTRIVMETLARMVKVRKISMENFVGILKTFPDHTARSTAYVQDIQSRNVANNNAVLDPDFGYLTPTDVKSINWGKGEHSWD